MANPEQESAPSAWTRLRERKVVAWGLAYAAIAWALLQVFGFTADTFHWPEATKQIAALLAALGLPVTVTLAWFHGERGADVSIDPYKRQTWRKPVSERLHPGT